MKKFQYYDCLVRCASAIRALQTALLSIPIHDQDEVSENIRTSALEESARVCMDCATRIRAKKEVSTMNSSIVRHGTDADCPSVKSGRYEYCPGHIMSGDKTLIEYWETDEAKTERLDAAEYHADEEYSRRKDERT